MEKRAKMFEKLLLEHKALSKQHSVLQLELRNKGTELFAFCPTTLCRQKTVDLLSLFLFHFSFPTSASGSKEQMDELIKRVENLQGRLLSMHYSAIALFIAPAPNLLC